ncbi:MAG: hypothetical protein LUD51_01505 [Clostridia bacterium]|nr:hypothetical protein [Clostridia bacterium]
MAKDKKKASETTEEKPFDFSNAGFCFCAEVVALYGEVNYKQSTDILMDQLVSSSIDAGEHITAFTSIPESRRPQAAEKCVEYMDKTMFLVFLLVKLGLFREKATENLVLLSRATKRALLKYCQGNAAGPVIIEAGDDDGFYDNADPGQAN